MGFKVNKGRFGRPTSVSLGSKAFRVNVGARRSSVSVGKFRTTTYHSTRRNSRKLTTTELAIRSGNWVQASGMWNVEMTLPPSLAMTAIVNASNLTFEWLERIRDGRHELDPNKIARALNTVFKQWDLTSESGDPIPISAAGVRELGFDFVTSLCLELTRGFGSFPSLTAAMTNQEGLKVVTVRRERFQDGTVGEPIVFDPNASPDLGSESKRSDISGQPGKVPHRKSLPLAYVLWLTTGYLGGHRYYLGDVRTGLLMTLTVGGLLIGWVTDFFRLPGLVKARNDHHQ